MLRTILTSCWAMLSMLSMLFCSSSDIHAAQNLTDEQLEQLQNAVVTIESSNSMTTGLLVEKKDRTGIFVTATARHNFVSTDRVNVIVSRGGMKVELTGKILGSDADLGLALVEVVSDELPPMLTMAKSFELQVTDQLWFAGYPDNEMPKVSVSPTSITALRKNNRLDLIQIDSNIAVGLAGSPLLNQQLQVVGVAIGGVKNARLSVARPLSSVRELMEGIVGTTLSMPVPGSDGFSLQARFCLPGRKVKSVKFHLVQPASAEKANLDQGVSWPALESSKSFDADKLDQTRAQCVFTLSGMEKANWLVQVEIIDEFDKRVYSRPLVLSKGKAVEPLREYIKGEPEVDAASIIKPLVEPTRKPLVSRLAVSSFSSPMTTEPLKVDGYSVRVLPCKIQVFPNIQMQERFPDQIRWSTDGKRLFVGTTHKLLSLSYPNMDQCDVIGIPFTNNHITKEHIVSTNLSHWFASEDFRGSDLQPGSAKQAVSSTAVAGILKLDNQNKVSLIRAGESNELPLNLGSKIEDIDRLGVAANGRTFWVTSRDVVRFYKLEEDSVKLLGQLRNLYDQDEPKRMFQVSASPDGRMALVLWRPFLHGNSKPQSMNSKLIVYSTNDLTRPVTETELPFAAIHATYSHGHRQFFFSALDGYLWRMKVDDKSIERVELPGPPPAFVELHANPVHKCLACVSYRGIVFVE